MPITYNDHLLPPGATQLERVLSAAGHRVHDIPVPIDRLKRPFFAETDRLVIGRP